jgi:hypothetical protein
MIIFEEYRIVYFWKSGRRVIFFIIRESENIIWQLLIRMVKIWIIIILTMMMMIIIVIIMII